VFALAAGLFTAVTALPAVAQGTMAQQQACQGDAMRLCGAFIPDVDRVRACMVSRMRYLSPACRAQFTSGPSRKHHRHYRH
jgi:hypothetical protein